MDSHYDAFVKIKEDTPVDLIPSLCISCRETGETRIMTTKIPFFKGKLSPNFNVLQIFAKLKK